MHEIGETYIDWIRDAHAMEEQALTMLKGQADRIENYPKLKARIEQHIRETEDQVQALRHVLERLDGDTSMFKDAAGKMMAMMQSFSGIFASDEVMKGTLASYTFEHMEIESYRLLITAADVAGDQQSIPVFERILQQEKDMADWLAANSAELCRVFLSRTGADSEAKR